MDDEVRKAMRILERAGINVVSVDHNLIIKAALEFIKADGKMGLEYCQETYQTRSILAYLVDGNKEKVSGLLTEGVRYYLGLAKFIYEEGKSSLNV